MQIVDGLDPSKLRYPGESAVIPGGPGYSFLPAALVGFGLVTSLAWSGALVWGILVLMKVL